MGRSLWQLRGPAEARASPAKLNYNRDRLDLKNLSPQGTIAVADRRSAEVRFAQNGAEAANRENRITRCRFCIL